MQLRPSTKRIAFSQSNLAEHSEGPDGALLLKALRIPPPRQAQAMGYAFTHGFHAYPGRFHPCLPRTLLSHNNAASQVMCDPFMGGGTAIVEALLAGWQAIGNDMNPIGRLVTNERVRMRSIKQADTLCDLTRSMAGEVESLLMRSKGGEGRIPRYERRSLARIAPHHAPHVMAELSQWLRLIDNLHTSAAKESLRAVLSSVVVKFSHFAAGGGQPNTAGEQRKNTNYPKGAVTRHIVATCQRLTRAQVALRRLTPPGFVQPRLLVEDSRLLPTLKWGEVQRVVSSPPYPGVYDYHHQHWLRMAWLGYATKPLHQQEITPKRRHRHASQQWRQDFTTIFSTLARVVSAEGDVFLVIGDWISSNENNTQVQGVNGAQALYEVASDDLWEMTGIGSIRRRVFSSHERLAFGERGKWEHVLHFKRRSFSNASSTDAQLLAKEMPKEPTGRPSQDIIQVWRQNGRHQGLDKPRHTGGVDGEDDTFAALPTPREVERKFGSPHHGHDEGKDGGGERSFGSRGGSRGRSGERSFSLRKTTATIEAEESPEKQFQPLTALELRSKSAKIVKRRGKVLE